MIDFTYIPVVHLGSFSYEIFRDIQILAIPEKLKKKCQYFLIYPSGFLARAIVDIEQTFSHPAGDGFQKTKNESLGFGNFELFGLFYSLQGVA